MAGRQRAQATFCDVGDLNLRQAEKLISVFNYHKETHNCHKDTQN